MSTQSKFLSLVLRHNPSAGDLTLDSEGWAKVSDVLRAVQNKFGSFSRANLNELVTSNDKQRFSFNDDGDKIRANQGHSVGIDLKLEPQTPPTILYHGTKTKNLGSIFAEGLKPGSRQHVHLSADVETATIVGNRRSGESVILLIHTTKMTDHSFYLSSNGVWLTDHVPPPCIEVQRGAGCLS
jgi:putative RNA 2'-phosphotransferase